MSAYRHSIQKHKAVQQLAFDKLLHGLHQIYNWLETLVAATGKGFETRQIGCHKQLRTAPKRRIVQNRRLTFLVFSVLLFRVVQEGSILLSLLLLLLPPLVHLGGITLLCSLQHANSQIEATAGTATRCMITGSSSCTGVIAPLS